MSVGKKITYFSGICLGLLCITYIGIASYFYFRSTFFIYPDIKEKYEIQGEINTPEEALEVCRSNFSQVVDGKSVNLVRVNFWDSKLRRLDQVNAMNPEEKSLMQISVMRNWNSWSIRTTIEQEHTKKCYLACWLKYRTSVGRCDIDFNGNLLAP